MVLIPALLYLGASTLALAQSQCPGYAASNVQQTESGLTADLQLAGPACHIYGTDLPNLTLTVEYQTGALRVSDGRDPSVDISQPRDFMLSSKIKTRPCTKCQSRFSLAQMLLRAPLLPTLNLSLTSPRTRSVLLCPVRAERFYSIPPDPLSFLNPSTSA